MEPNMTNIIFLSLLLQLQPQAAHASDMPAACEDADKIYKHCSNQEDTYKDALAKAKKDKKQLIVVIAAEWCPWCMSLHKMLGDSSVLTPELVKKYSTVVIALFPPKDSKTKIPTGLVVRDLLQKQANHTEKLAGIPIMALVNPKSGKATLIDTEPLEKNTDTSKGHDSAKVLAALEKAANTVK